ncbi:hypothetical protein B0W81_02300 [Prochlorococcus sp. HOT_208_60]|nr:hypothetical protein B0W81_02300 [Prochlorococcus sp. HOT_208_60]
MAKRLTAQEKEKLISDFTEGEIVEILSQRFECTKLTVIRNLKKSLGEKVYFELASRNNLSQKEFGSREIDIKSALNEEKKKELDDIKSDDNDVLNSIPNNSNYSHNSSFLEIVPLDFDIENSPRKELSSVHISEVDLPKIAYIIVDKQTELQVKLIKDYPDWEFLPQDDLNRKAFEIYLDLKDAKRFCNNEQKVIKVPNTKVFKIAAPHLISRGISRIVNADQLIAL